MDLLLNGNNSNTPGYAIYNNGVPTKLALFNFITDPTGANDITVSVSIGGGSTGQALSTGGTVTVKYFSTYTGSTADKFNLTWGGQTMGDQYGSDGRLQGNVSTTTIVCTNSICNIPVKAPQFALVYLNNNDTINPTLSTQTWPTSVQTRLEGPVLVPASILSTSNGRGGAQEAFNVGDTSSGGIGASSAAERRMFVSWGVMGLVAILSGWWLVLGR